MEALKSPGGSDSNVQSQASRHFGRFAPGVTLFVETEIAEQSERETQNIAVVTI